MLHYQRGQEYPYDRSGPEAPVSPGDWATRAARGVLYDLNDRRGIKNELRLVDEGVRCEMVETLAEIIRVARDSEGR